MINLANSKSYSNAAVVCLQPHSKEFYFLERLQLAERGRTVKTVNTIRQYNSFRNLKKKSFKNFKNVFESHKIWIKKCVNNKIENFLHGFWGYKFLT